MMPNFLQLDTTPILKIQYFHLITVDFQPKTLLILFPSIENSTTGIAIMPIHMVFFRCLIVFHLLIQSSPLLNHNIQSGPPEVSYLSPFKQCSKLNRYTKSYQNQYFCCCLTDWAVQAVLFGIPAGLCIHKFPRTLPVWMGYGA